MNIQSLSANCRSFNYHSHSEIPVKAAPEKTLIYSSENEAASTYSGSMSKDIAFFMLLPPELWGFVLHYLTLKEIYCFRGANKGACTIANTFLSMRSRSNLFEGIVGINNFLAAGYCQYNDVPLTTLYRLVHAREVKCGRIAEVKILLLTHERDRKIEKLIDAGLFKESQKEKLLNIKFNPVQLRFLRSSNFILSCVRGAELNIDAFLQIPDRYISIGIYEAISAGQMPIVGDMVASGVFLNAQSTFGYAPLHEFAMTGNVRLLKIFFNFAPNVHIRDCHGYTALHHAAQRDVPEMVVCLLSHGIDAQSLDNAGCPPLLHAMKNKRTENARILIQKMTRFDAIDADKMTAMHYAVKHHDLDNCLALIDNKASVSAPNALGYTALHYAVIEKFSLFFNPLVEAGADHSQLGVNRFTAYVNKKDAQGLTALHHAARNGSVEAVLFLKKHGANIEAADSFNRIPLHYAASYGRSELIPLLISDEVRDLACDFGWTAVHYGALFGQSRVLHALLDAGASFTKRDKKGKTAFDYAFKYLHLQAANILFTCYMRNFIKQSFMQIVRLRFF